MGKAVKHRQCHKCKYAGGDPDNNREIHCYYAGVTQMSCLYYGPDGKIADRRGKDPDNCLLFSEGERLSLEKHRNYRGVGNNK